MAATTNPYHHFPGQRAVPRPIPSHIPVGVGDLPGRDDESGVVILPAERTTLPSSFEERFGIQPGEHCDGVGSLPGHASESSVALLPAERVTLPSSFEERTGVHPGDKGGGVGPLPGNNNEEGVIRRWEEVALQDPPRLSSPFKSTSAPLENQANTLGTATAYEFSKPEMQPETKIGRSASDSKKGQTEESPPHKPSLMSKLKGEVRIIHGKISKDENKITEGRRLKSGI